MISKERAKKFHTDDMSLPRSGWYSWLIKGNFLHGPTTQKYYPDVGGVNWSESSQFSFALLMKQRPRNKNTCGMRRSVELKTQPLPTLLLTDFWIGLLCFSVLFFSISCFKQKTIPKSTKSNLLSTPLHSKLNKIQGLLKAKLNWRTI